MFNVYQQVNAETQEMALAASFEDVETANTTALDLFNQSGLVTTVESDEGGLSRIVTINKPEEQTNA